MKRKYIIIAIVIPVAFFLLLTSGPHEKEDGIIGWQTALLPEEFYEEKEWTSGFLPDTYRRNGLEFSDTVKLGELSAHTPPTLKEKLDYHAGVVSSIGFKSYGNPDIDGIRHNSIGKDIEFHIYRTVWEKNGNQDTMLVDIWRYESVNHATIWHSHLLDGEYITWQIKPMPLKGFDDQETIYIKASHSDTYYYLRDANWEENKPPRPFD